MKKIFSLALAGVMIFSALPMAYAADVDYQNGTEVEYTGSRTTVNADGTETHNAEYTITVPAKLAPGGSGTVTLQGMWPSDATVKVTAEDQVEMVNNINSADKKTLAVTFTAIELAGNNTVAVSDDETVSVADISNALFGTWAGKFNYNVEYNGEAGGSGTVTPTPDPDQPVDPDTGDDSTCSHINNDGNETCDICGATRVNYQLGIARNASCYEGDTFGYIATFAASEMTIQPDGSITFKDYGTIYYNGNPVSKDDVIMAVQYDLVKEANLITFTIDGKEYQAEEGMTFGEWIESDYNTDGYYRQDETSISNVRNAEGKRVAVPGGSTIINVQTEIEEKDYSIFVSDQ